MKTRVATGYRNSIALLGSMAALIATTGAAPAGDPGAPPLPRPSLFERCETCRGCHENIYREHVGSMHSRSFANPVFLAQYTQQVLPLARSSVDGFKDARSCTSCHAPVAHRLSRARVVVPDAATAQMSSVTCDFCHTIKGYRGEEPLNANYVVEPGPLKLGPLETQTDWHHQYSELQTRSEFCAICHSVRNRFGLAVKSTYAEWKESRHAKEGIQCQDCHMNLDGFLTEGRPSYASGVAAFMSLGSAPKRPELHTHAFPGARSHSQIDGAIGLAFRLSPDQQPSPGEVFQVDLHIDNSRTGHKMPSGSAELRFLWLDVFAEIGDQRVDFSPGKDPSGYDVTGRTPKPEDATLVSGVPPGRRIYRALLADGRGRVTLASHLAQSILYDNRLNASEVRTETYAVEWPAPAGSRAVLRAVMYYVAYPDSFADQLGLPRATHVPIAAASAEIPVKQTKPAPDRSLRAQVASAP